MNSVNFMRTMTDVEIDQWNKELDEFWNNLDWSTKNDVKRLLDPYLQRVECKHEFIDPDTYENDLDKNYLYCKKCHYKIKKIKNEW